MCYYTIREDQFKIIFILFGAIWPLVLWFELLTSILQDYADWKKCREIRNKAHYFNSHQGELHPELRDGINKEIKRKAKYRGNRPIKKPAKGYGSSK
jgi:hypothetical protein